MSTSPTVRGPKTIDQLETIGVLTGNEYIPLQLGKKTWNVQLAQLRDFLGTPAGASFLALSGSPFDNAALALVLSQITAGVIEIPIPDVTDTQAAAALAQMNSISNAMRIRTLTLGAE